MLYDRDYMREPERHRVQASVALLWVLGACFIVQCVLLVYGQMHLDAVLGLSRAGMARGQVWQLLTFQFLHSAPWPFHLLGNCLGLYFFGRTVEEVFGTRRFLLWYLAGGVFGGLLQLAVDWAFQRPAAAAVIGASAGVSTMMAAFCQLFPERQLTTYYYFFPVTMRARTLLWILVGISLLGAVIAFDNIAHAAHLGGLGIGCLAVALADPDGWWQRWRGSRRVEVRPTPRPRAATARREPDPPPSSDSVSSRVDPILDKIAAHGIQSLTEAERRTLEEAGRKIGRR